MSTSIEVENSASAGNWKARIETGFGNLGLAIARHPFVWFAAFLLVISALASQLVNIRTDASIEGFLEEGAIEIIRYNEFKSTFGRDEFFIISIEAEDIFDPEFAKNLRNLHRQIEDEVPYVDAVDSLVNARHTIGRDDALYIEDLLPETIPEDPKALQKLKDYTYDNPSYVDFLISRDRQLISMTVKLKSFLYEEDDEGNSYDIYLDETHQREALNVIEEILDQYRGPLSDDIRVAGSMPISLMLGEIIERDFGVFTGLAILLISLLLLLIFRRASGVLMPIVVMVLGIVVTVSFMAIMDTPIQVSTSILPSFLLAVCVGDSIHLLTIFYRHFDQGDEKHVALAKAMEHTGLAILFTSITTAAGLASFATSELSPVSALGFYGALGSIVAFLLTITILPCLISMLPLKRRPIHEDTKSLLQKFLMWCARFSTSNPKIIVTCGALIFVLAAGLASQSRFSHLPLSWMPDDHPALLALQKHEDRMGASMSIEVVIDTGLEKGVANSDFMKALEKTVEEIETWETDVYKVTKVVSVTNIVKESNRALHENQQSHYVIPDNSQLISQELFLIEMDKPEDLFNLIDRDYQQARITVLIPWIDALYLPGLIERMKKLLAEELGPHSEAIHTTGVVDVLGATFAEMLYSTAESYGLAAIVITFMMILLIGSIRLGLISMIPSLLPILIVLSGLHLLNIPLDMLTMLIGSIAIGLTVDDNVHFMHGFRKTYLKTRDPVFAVEQTLSTSGRAMLITSIVLSIGFAIYSQSEMKNMITFGVTTALCIALALTATFILAPALMMLSNKPAHKVDKD